MFKVYFKQAIQMLKQNRFISIISIAGTALAIMMIMTIVVVHEMKTLSVDPEPNRNRTLYISFHQLKNKPEKGDSFRQNPLNEEQIQRLSQLQTPETISFFSMNLESLGRSSSVPVWGEGQQEEYLKKRRSTDAAYWNVFNLRFREGRPYTEEEFRSGDHVAVLSESLARQLYKEVSPIGKGFVADFKTYRVIGVVADVSRVFEDAHADFWVPYTTAPDVYRAALLMSGTKADNDRLNKELHGLEEKHNVENDTWDLTFLGPYTRWQDHSSPYGFVLQNFGMGPKAYNRQQVFILLVLLLVPALNLSGFSLSRVRKRMSEIGIRKAFGAKRGTILTQILYENLITSLLGGLIGLALSWLVLLNFRYWLLGVPAGDTLPVGVMVSPVTWVAVFLVCFLLNVLSAGLPAWRAARMTIVHSINQNDKTL